MMLHVFLSLQLYTLLLLLELGASQGQVEEHQT